MFFVHVILPELTGQLFTRPQSANIAAFCHQQRWTVSGNNTDLICLCQVPYDDLMMLWVVITRTLGALVQCVAVNLKSERRVRYPFEC